MCTSAPTPTYKTCSQSCMYAHLHSTTLVTQDMAGSLTGEWRCFAVCVQACNDEWYLSNVLFVDQINQSCRAGGIITFLSARDKPDREKCTMKPKAQPVVKRTDHTLHTLLCFAICICWPPAFACSLMLH